MYILQSSSAMTSGNFLFKSMELAPLNEEPRRFMQIFFPPSTRAHTFLIGRLQSRVELESNVAKSFMKLQSNFYFPIFSQNCFQKNNNKTQSCSVSRETTDVTVTRGMLWSAKV